MKLFAVYSGPEGCTDEECDCTEDVIHSRNDEGLKVTTSTWSCEKSYPTDYIRIPPSVLQIFENVNVFLKDLYIFSAIAMGVLQQYVQETIHTFAVRLTDAWKSLWNGLNITSVSAAFPKTISSLKNSCDSIKSTLSSGWDMLNKGTDLIMTESEMIFQRLWRHLFAK
ncbi:unnamed protein product [Orchesella dallaii]|uniref:Uncharacterized protein n=1 Tax=Orchesella dallaii TaxID=48710 RepID=A0ABP1RB12_9HEXA